jgi:predicted transcriptional regulator
MTKQRKNRILEGAREALAIARSQLDPSTFVIHGGAYRASPEELAGIDRGLRDSAEGRSATDEEVEAVFAKHRR